MARYRAGSPLREPIVRIVPGTLLALMARRTFRPARPTLFSVDKLGHLGAMPPLRQAVTLLRDYGVRVALFVQSPGQLKSLWSREHETIAESCGPWLTLGNTSLAAARQVAAAAPMQWLAARSGPSL